jgi:hypothetical protein
VPTWYTRTELFWAIVLDFALAQDGAFCAAAAGTTGTSAARSATVVIVVLRDIHAPLVEWFIAARRAGSRRPASI